MDEVNGVSADEVVEKVRDGMRRPSRVRLLPPLRLVRFASAGWSSESRLGSPWWIRESDDLQQEAAARGGRFSEGLAWRFALAVPQSLGNRMDVMVTVEVRQPLEAFEGVGRPQLLAERAVNGAYVSWMGSPSLRQLYIPGIVENSKRRLTALGSDALVQVSVRHVESHQLPVVRSR